MSEILLASDLGYGVPWLAGTLMIIIVVTSGFFIYIALSTRKYSKETEGENVKGIKYKLHKYNAERYWAIFIAGTLIWLWILGYPWMPPVAFEKALSNNSTVHLINVTAAQWYWIFKDEGITVDKTFQNPSSEMNTSPTGNYGVQVDSNNTKSNPTSQSSSTLPSSQTQGPILIKTGEMVKFVARSLDVNHGFGILQSSKSMDVPLMQMQVVPGFDNVFYFTFDKPGNYTVRCLEYCGWQHPFMVSQITVVDNK